MSLLLLSARLLLAAVFVVAGLAKFADLPGSRTAIRDFGLPSSLAYPLGALLPLAELLVAFALIPRAAAWWGGLGALALLLLFIIGIGVSMARGRTPDCHCFGQLHSEPIGWPTLARNGLLAAIAGFVVGFGRVDAGRSAVTWLGALTTAERVGTALGVAGLVALGAIAWLLVQVVRQNGRFILRFEAIEQSLAQGFAAGTYGEGGTPLIPAPVAPGEGLSVGTVAPAFSLAGLYGETLTLDALRGRGRSTLLLFTDPHCGPCTALLPALGRWQREHAGTLTIALLSRGTVEENRAKSSEHGLVDVLLQSDREVAEAYNVQATPGAVLVGTDGRIGSAAALGADAIERLIAGATGSPIALPAPMLLHPSNEPPAPVAPRIGELAPTLTLPDLSGQLVGLKRFRGRPTLVLFWNPGCGFCEQMLDDLKAWEHGAGREEPQLLVVSTGTVEENRAMGLTGTVVLDPSFQTLQAFGASGTPSAILVDARGKIASELAVGADAVLALARQDHVRTA